MKRNFNLKGFTLIELIIVIAVIALLAAATFVAVDPAKRIGQARDAQRWADVTAIADAVSTYVADNTGTYPTSTVTAGTYYAVMGYGAGGAASATCQNRTVTTLGVSFGTNLVSTYLPTMPVDPAGSAIYGTVSTGYYFMKNAAGRTIVGACKESDYATASIYVQR